LSPAQNPDMLEYIEVTLLSQLQPSTSLWINETKSNPKVLEA